LNATVRRGSLAEASSGELRKRAMDLLARREHARAELRRKLRERDAPEALLEETLDGLVADGLLSDERFVDAFIAQQCSRGKGPVAIEHGLRERGVSGAALAAAMASLEADWCALARREREKRFGAAPPSTPQERARQARFLRGRGFSGEQIHRVLGSGAAPDDVAD
jgi:regulatory protein